MSTTSASSVIRRNFREVSFPAEVGVAEDREITEVGVAAHASDVRQPLAEVWFPHPFLGRLGCEQRDALAFVQNQSFDKHQADKGLAETDAVAQECPAMLAG